MLMVAIASAGLSSFAGQTHNRTARQSSDRQSRRFGELDCESRV